MKFIFEYTGALLTFSILLLAGCQIKEGSDSDAADTNAVSAVIADSFVAPEGQILDKVIYEFESDLASDAYEPRDIDIEVVVDTTEPGSETETESTEKVTIENANIENNQLVLDLEDLPYGTLNDVTITSSDGQISSTKEDFQVTTKTADKFEKFTFTDSAGIELTYWLYVPEDSESVPLVVWEHGGGEVLDASYEGAQLLTSQGATTWVENAPETAVLSVQYPENYEFGISENPDQLAQMEAFSTAKYELIQQLISENIVDQQKLYITGASSGGGGALRFIMQYPELFAGALIICAKDTVISLSNKYDLAYQLEDEEKLRITDEEYEASYEEMKATVAEIPKLTDVPIWFVHAENDQVTTSYTSMMMYDALEEKGATNNNLTLYSNEDMAAGGIEPIYHASWSIAYQNQEMIDWLFEQSN